MKRALYPFLILLLLGTCSPKDKDITVLNVGLGHGKSHSFTLALEKFQKRIAAKTSGKVLVKIYPASQLGNESEMQEMLTIGSLDMTVAGLVNNYEPLFSIYELPYLFRDREHVKLVNNGPILKKTALSLEKNGIRMIGWYENGFRHLSNSKRPINSPEDLNGLLIRTPENMAQVETIRAMGGIPTPLSYSELYTALIQGVVDGQENPLQNIWTGRLYETQKHVALTGHIFNCAYVLISEKTWAKIPEAYQPMIEEAVAFSTEWQLQYMMEQDKVLQQKLELEGLIFSRPDTGQFEKRTEKVYDYFYQLYGQEARELVEMIKKTF